MVYVPAIVIEELDHIQEEEEISSRATAFEKMVRNCKYGRGVKKKGRSKDLDIFGGL